MSFSVFKFQIYDPQMQTMLQTTFESFELEYECTNTEWL